MWDSSRPASIGPWSAGLLARTRVRTCRLVNGFSPRYHYSVVRNSDGAGHMDVALVRSSAPESGLKRLRHRDAGDAVVVQHRSFRPLLELNALEAYAAQLERAAAHGNEGTLGCFVDIDKRADGVVRVALYERWMDGSHLRCDELTVRDFDSNEDQAVASSAEFLAELQAWAEQRNSEREMGEIETRVADAVQSERALDQTEAARQLAEILDATSKRA